MSEEGVVGLPIHVAKASPLTPLVLAGVLEIRTSARWAVLAIYDSKDALQPGFRGARIGELARVLLNGSVQQNR